MITVTVFSCPHCGASVEIQEGVGTRDILEDVFYWDGEEPPILQEYVRPTIFQKAASLIESGWIPKEGFGYRRHFCPICKTVESRFHFRLEKDGKSWFPTFKCGKCQSHLVPITGNHPPGSLRRRKEEECSRYIRCTHCGELIDTFLKKDC